MDLIVNYIWARRLPTDDACIPPKAFAAFQKNVAENPGLSFNLWVEDRAVYHGYAIFQNIEVHLLDELYPAIDDLEKAPTFEAKIDLLRLLVLKKVLTENPKAISVYSDFDLIDLKLGSEEFRDRMDAYGVAFSGSYRPFVVKNIWHRFLLPPKTETIKFGNEVISSLIETFRYKAPSRRVEYVEYGIKKKSEFENGFIAFKAERLPLLNAMISEAAKIFANPPQEGDLRDIVYFSMVRVLDEFAASASKENHIPTDWRKKIASFYVQYCSGWKLTDNAALVPISAAVQNSRDHVVCTKF